MNWDIVKGNWKQFSGKAKAEWGKLTDDELTEADGRREQLVGLVQKHYGESRDVVEKKVDSWLQKHS